MKKKEQTMHEVYGEPDGKLGKHICCNECGFCRTCGDCKCKFKKLHHPKLKKEKSV